MMRMGDNRRQTSNYNGVRVMGSVFQKQVEGSSWITLYRRSVLYSMVGKECMMSYSSVTMC